MINLKNIKFKELVFWVSAGLILGNLFVLFIFLQLSNFFEDKWLRFLFLALSSFINLYAIWYVLEKFVFREIKMLYKSIRDIRLSKDDKAKEDFGALTLSSVTDEVEGWANKTQSELESIWAMEEYRKNFVGNISHELKTPVFTIQGYLLTLLEGGIYDSNINKLYIDKALKNLDRLQSIIEDLEVISFYESKDIALNKTKIELNEFIVDIFEDLERRAAEKNIKFLIKEGVNLNLAAFADKNAIRQVFNNLLINSVKYGQVNGTTKVSFYNMDDHVLIEVSDNGIGIDQKHLKHLFDRFYRVDVSRSRSEGGSGLGLSIVKHIIEAHNQTISVRSTPGIGTTFSFTLAKS